jgi:hypothetical protein
MQAASLRNLRKVVVVLIEGMDYYVRYVALPRKVHGMTVLDENGFHNVYINSLLSREEQRAAYDHELEHIRGDDFSKTDLPLEQVENII